MGFVTQPANAAGVLTARSTKCQAKLLQHNRLRRSRMVWRDTTDGCLWQAPHNTSRFFTTRAPPCT